MYSIGFKFDAEHRDGPASHYCTDTSNGENAYNMNKWWCPFRSLTKYLSALICYIYLYTVSKCNPPGGNAMTANSTPKLNPWGPVTAPRSHVLASGGSVGIGWVKVIFSSSAMGGGAQVGWSNQLLLPSFSWSDWYIPLEWNLFDPQLISRLSQQVIVAKLLERQSELQPPSLMRPKKGMIDDCCSIL